MIYRKNLLKLALVTLIPATIISTASAETMVKKTATMADGTELTVTQTTDVNKAADSVILETTTYSYDVNRDGYMDNSETVTYFTRYADRNNDGFIDAGEYENGSMNYFSNMLSNENTDDEARSYTYWDKDKDNRLDKGEVETLVTNTGFYKKWDTNKDGKISQVEFSMGTFTAYDDNGDNVISKDEWADVVM